jgi:hypothetical protein
MVDWRQWSRHMHALVDSEEDPNEVDGVRVGSYVQVQDASASHHGEIGYVCKVDRIRVGHHHSALVTFDDLDAHADASLELEPVVLDHAGKHKTDITSTMRTTLYRIDQLTPVKSAEKVLIADPSSKHYNEIGNVVHWEESESLYTVVFKSDSVAEPASTFYVNQVEVVDPPMEESDTVRVVNRKDEMFGCSGKIVQINDDDGAATRVTVKLYGRKHKICEYEKSHLHRVDDERTLQQTHPIQYEFECYALFTVVEMLRSAILAINFQGGSSSRTSAEDLKQIEAIVKNQAMWEWFTERIGQTDVVRNGQNIPS